LSYAAKLLEKDLPPAEDFLSAELSEMARSFYAESKRVKNSKIKYTLGVELKHPDYKSGLKSLFQQEFKNK
jgi:hypothetical protein